MVQWRWWSLSSCLFLFWLASASIHSPAKEDDWLARLLPCWPCHCPFIDVPCWWRFCRYPGWVKWQGSSQDDHFFSEAFERGSSFAMGFSWEFPEWESNPGISLWHLATGQRDPRLPDSCCWTAIHFISHFFFHQPAWRVIFGFLGLLFLVGNTVLVQCAQSFGGIWHWYVFIYIYTCIYIYMCIYIYTYMQIYFGFICD